MRDGRDRLLSFLVLFNCLLLTACSASNVPAGREILYVTNSAGDDVTVIDAVTHEVIGSIETGPTPHGLEASPDGSVIYVSGETDDDVVAVSTATSTVLWRTKVGDRPNHIAISHDGRYVYVPIRSGDYADVVDTQLRSRIKSIPVGLHPHNAYPSPDGKWAYVTSMGEDKITIIDIATQSAIGEIPVGGEPRPAAITNDNKWMYVALTGLHGFVVADIEKRAVVHKVELPPADTEDISTYGYTPTHGLGLRPDNKQFWITNVFGGAVEVFSVPDHKLLGTVDVGPAPNWMAFSPDGRRLYVSNSGSDDVSVIDTERIREIVRIPVGRAPKRLLVVRVPGGMSGPKDKGWSVAAKRPSATDYFLRGGGVLSLETGSLQSLLDRRELTLESVATLCRRTGIRGISLSARQFESWEDDYLDRIRKTIAADGRTVVALALDEPLLAGRPDGDSARLDAAEKLIRAARRLGAPIVSIPIGAGVRTGAGVDRGIAMIRKLVPAAREHGTKLAIHRAAADDILRIIRETDPFVVGACVDFADWKDSAALYADVPKLAPHALHIRARAASFDRYGEESSVDFRRALLPLATSGYGRAVAIAFAGSMEPLNGISRTRDLLVKRWVGTAPTETEEAAAANQAK